MLEQQTHTGLTREAADHGVTLGHAPGLPIRMQSVIPGLGEQEYSCQSR